MSDLLGCASKRAALGSLGIYASLCPQAFVPFIAKSLELALSLAEYFHDDVREEAYRAFAHILKAALLNYPSTGRPPLLMCSPV